MPVVEAKLKVPQQVARIIKEGTPEEQLRAARGEIPLAARDLLTTLLFLAHGGHPQIRKAALHTVQRIRVSALQQILTEPELHPRLLDFLARARMHDTAAMAGILAYPVLPAETLRYLVAHAPPAVLEMLGNHEPLLARHPDLRALLAANPQFPQCTPMPSPDAPTPSSQTEAEAPEEEVAQEGAEEEVNLSKYQQSLEMGVSEKIKMALTGDKEWRAIFLKDANKLVCGAVMKNPRISDGEVLAVAKNKASSEELIRLITLNPEWAKNTEIQKALVTHPRTPLPKALRYMNVLTEKDLKILSKSRGVSQVIVNTARRLLQAKAQKK